MTLIKLNTQQFVFLFPKKTGKIFVQYCETLSIFTFHIVLQDLKLRCFLVGDLQ